MQEARRLWQEFARDQAALRPPNPLAEQQRARGAPDRAAINARAERSALSLAQAEARLAAAQGDSARAAAILRGALSATTAETRQTIAARTQLANVERRAAAESERSAGALRGLGRTAAGFGAALGALGLVEAARQIALFAVEAGRSAIELERTEATIRQLAGSQARYNQIVELAKSNQLLFGGSLNDNLVPLNSFLQLSNRTGASLENLNRLSQLLIASAPGRTFDDASFSLSEFLAQNGAEAALSLADRFNLPKSALTELAQAGTSAEQRLSGLQDLLARQGVTAETLAASLTKNAEVYGRLGAQASEAINRIGKAAADEARPVAEFFAGVFEQFNRIAGAGERAAALAPAIFAGAEGDFEAYARGVQFVNEQLTVGSVRIGEYGANVVVGGQLLEQLTRRQFDFAEALAATGIAREEAQQLVAGLSNAQIRYADSLIAQGVAAAQATERAREFGSTIDAVNAVQGRLFDDAGASSDQLKLLGGTMLEVAQRTAEGRAEVERLAAEYQNGRISSNELEDAVLALADAQDRAAVQAQVREAADRALEDQARATARALLDAGVDGEAAAERLAASGDRVDQLTAKYLRLGLAADAALGRGAAAEGLAALGRGVDAAPESGGKSQGESVLDTFRREVAAERAEEAAKEAERRRRAAAREATKDANEAERAREQARRELERRAEEVDRALKEVEDRYAEHYRELRQAEEDYALDSSRAREDFERERRRLLAEGRRAEAQALTAQFELEQRRRAEDRDRERQRQAEDTAREVAEIRERAELDGPVPLRLDDRGVRGVASPDQLRLASPALVPGAAGAPPLVVRAERSPIDLKINIAPVQLLLDGDQIATATWPEIREQLTSEMATGEINITNPTINGQVVGVRGPR